MNDDEFNDYIEINDNDRKTLLYQAFIECIKGFQEYPEDSNEQMADELFLEVKTICSECRNRKVGCQCWNNE